MERSEVADPAEVSARLAFPCISGSENVSSDQNNGIKSRLNLPGSFQ